MERIACSVCYFFEISHSDSLLGLTTGRDFPSHPCAVAPLGSHACSLSHVYPLRQTFRFSATVNEPNAGDAAIPVHTRIAIKRRSSLTVSTFLRRPPTGSCHHPCETTRRVTPALLFKRACPAGLQWPSWKSGEPFAFPNGSFFDRLYRGHRKKSTPICVDRPPFFQHSRSVFDSNLSCYLPPCS